MSKYRFGADLAVSASLPKHAVRAREAVKIGVLAPLTGDASAWGRPGFEGCQIWADWVNAEGGLRIGDQRRRVEIVAFDDQYDPARAVLGAKHLVLEQEVKIILMLGGDTVPAIGDFLTPQMVGGQSGFTFGRIIYSQFGTAFNWPFGAALSVILAVVVIAAIALGTAFGRDRSAVR